MPIYEFLCPSCNRIYSFHTFRADPDKVPTCPKCQASDLRRVHSSFGIGAAGAQLSDDDTGSPDLDDPKVEREMAQLMSQLEGIDESNPKAMAHAMRRVAEIAGEPITPAMEEMIRRIESGEDPEKVEEEMGDALEEEAGELGAGAAPVPPTRDSGLYPLR
jgi:putative FmdB family regulatory protein